MRFILGILFLTNSLIAIAEPQTTDEAIPKNLHVFSESGSTYVDHVAAGCSGMRYYIPPSHPQFDMIVSIIMAAQISNRSIVIRFDGCNSANQGKLIGVYLK